MPRNTKTPLLIKRNAMLMHKRVVIYAYKLLLSHAGVGQSHPTQYACSENHGRQACNEVGGMFMARQCRPNNAGTRRTK